MNKKILKIIALNSLFISMLVLFPTSCQNPKDIKIRNAIKNELALHPKSRITDIYKNFFQDAYGPGHMINDSAAAMDYLTYELRKAEKFDSIKIQALGIDSNYYRVNLSLVKDSVLPLNVLFYAFTESAPLASPPEMSEWKCFWQEIVRVVDNMELTIPGSNEDLEVIELNLKNNDPVIHHSEEFKRIYHPHYRIVHKNYIDTIRYYLEK